MLAAKNVGAKCKHRQDNYTDHGVFDVSTPKPPQTCTRLKELKNETPEMTA
jgi:hypothetical protein